MGDIDKLQEQIEQIDALIHALMPFCSRNKFYILQNIRRTLEPLKHLKEMTEMLEMVQAMQEMNI